jgi:DNA primase
MDVIALSEAGFKAVVAPLGTAVTETQLQMLWRMTPEPVIALDGDAAGIRAAMRVIDLALPMLSAGQSVRFAVLPEGLDPDDLIKAQGAAGMERVLEAAMPLVQLLWRRETEGKVFDSPERRAALDAALGAAIGKIQDQNLKHHYEQALKDLKWQLFNPRRGGQGAARKPWQPGQTRGFGKGAAPILPPTAHTKGSLLAAASGHVDEVLREAVILATLIVHPRLIETFESAFERIHMATPEHTQIQNVILSYHGEESEALRTEIASRCGAQSLEKLFALNHVTIAPPIRRADDGELAAMCLAEELAKLDAARGARREIAEATAEIDALVDEGLTWRLSEATRALDEARRGKGEDKGLYDRADNGVLLAREERAALEALLKLIDGEPGKGSS